MDVAELPVRGLQLVGSCADPLCRVTITESDDHPGYYDLTIITARESVSLRRPVQGSSVGLEAIAHCINSETQGAELQWSTEERTPHVVTTVSSTVVYFIADEDGYVKIGTAWSAASRLRDLQTASRQQLRILATMQGGHAEEAALHRRFASARLRGEWFQPVGELLQFIEDVSA
jgi:hypothetical protein